MIGKITTTCTKSLRGNALSTRELEICTTPLKRCQSWQEDRAANPQSSLLPLWLPFCDTFPPTKTLSMIIMNSLLLSKIAWQEPVSCTKCPSEWKSQKPNGMARRQPTDNSGFQSSRGECLLYWTLTRICWQAELLFGRNSKAKANPTNPGAMLTGWAAADPRTCIT